METGNTLIEGAGVKRVTGAERKTMHRSPKGLEAQEPLGGGGNMKKNREGEPSKEKRIGDIEIWGKKPKKT